MRFLRHLKSTFSFDYRSLALYRALLGLIVMVDVLYRLPDLTNFYTDLGLIPRSIFLNELAQPWSFSFHLANGSFGFAVFMFGLHFLFGFMLLLGYKTRWAALGAFVMAVSVHNRNWLVNNGGDDVLRAILFLSIFLPLNRTFSIDSALRKERRHTGEYFGTWGFAFFLQVFVIYFVSYVLKDHPIWRKDFTALFFASKLDIFATPLGVWLRDYPGFQKFLTIKTIFLEWGGPLLLVFAFAFGKRWWIARSVTVILFWGLHFGIIATMWIGVFPYTCLAMWTIFIPGKIWEILLAPYRKKITLYYDGECGFCQKGVRIVREFFLTKEARIAEAQSVGKIHEAMIKHHSWVVVNEKGKEAYHFSAWLEIMEHSPMLRLFTWFFRLGPVFAVCQRGYVWVSHHRPLMGKLTQFLEYESPKKEIKSLKWLNEFAGAFIFVTLLMWNLTTVRKYNVQALFFQEVTRGLHLYQEWNMFSPFPKMDNVWVEIPAILEDGSQIELLTGNRDIYSVKSDVFPKIVPNEHWRKFFLNLSESEATARYYGAFLCRWWNERRLGQLKHLTLRKMEINVYSQMNYLDGHEGPIEKKMNWKHWCFDADFKKDNPGQQR